MYEYLLWDLDGTLTDPMVGITSAVRHALRCFGIEEQNLQTLCGFIGPPLKQSFIKYYGFSDQRAEMAVEKYREYYTDTGIYENMIYPGISDLLFDLHKMNKILLLATSKPTVFAMRVLEYFSISSYFTFVSGSHLDGTRTDKAEVIAFALEQMSLPDQARVCMIGDRDFDMIGAKKSGIPGIGVTYGYGSREELKRAGAVHLADSVEDLRLLLKA